MNNSVWFFGDSFCAANEEGDVPIKGVGCQTIPDYWWGVEFANSFTMFSFWFIVLFTIIQTILYYTYKKVLK